VKLDEALKLIQADLDDEDVDWDTPLGSAYKLSFEALKTIIAARATKTVYILHPLPGETE